MTGEMSTAYEKPSLIISEVPDYQILREALEESIQDNLVPVFKVTKNEATFTKGDVKLQRVIVTETKLEESKPTDQSPRSKVPKLKQAFEMMVKKENASTMRKERILTPNIKPRRSSIPRLHQTKTLPPSTVKNKEITNKSFSEANVVTSDKIQDNIHEATTVRDINDPNTEPDDEFEKIYDEIVDDNSQKDLEENVLPVKIENPENIETNFDRIVSEYEEKPTTQPLDFGKMNKRIPFRKQKSLHYALPKRTERRLSLKDFQKIDTDKAVEVNVNETFNNDVIARDNRLPKTKTKEDFTKKISAVSNNHSSTVKILDTTQKEKNISTQKNDDAFEEVPSAGKLKRIIKNLLSKDDKVTEAKSDFANDTPVSVKQSISSKIAIFETEVTKPPMKSKVLSQKSRESNEKFQTKPIIIHKVLKEQSIQNVHHETRDKNINIISPNYSKDTVHINIDENKETAKYTVNLNVIDAKNKVETVYVAENFKPSTISKVNMEDDNVEINREYSENYEFQDDPPKSDNPNDIMILNAVEGDQTGADEVSYIQNLQKDHKEDFTPSQQKYYEQNVAAEIVKHQSEKDLIHKRDENQNQMSLNYKPLTSSKLVETLNLFEHKRTTEPLRRKSQAEIDLEDKLRGKVLTMIVRINSMENLFDDKKEGESKNVIIDRERPRRKSVSEKIALFEARNVIHPRFEKKLFPIQMDTNKASKRETFENNENQNPSNFPKSNEAPDDQAIELQNAKEKYGKVDMVYVVLNNGVRMPVLVIGTALLEPKLIHSVLGAAIDMGYRAIDTAHIYGNEKAVGEAIKSKIDDGTVKRSDLFIISKLWSTSHRRDLVEAACRASLEALGLDYLDLYLVHNPMSFKEGPDPIPSIANVLQYSSSADYLDAWYGMEALVPLGLARSVGVSNFNSQQLARVVEKGRIRPVVNQIECHPYLTQTRLSDFCSSLNVTVLSYGALGSKGTPADLKDRDNLTDVTAVIDDPLVKVMAAGLDVTPAQLLIRYQLDRDHAVVLKSTRASHLWANLQALKFKLTSTEIEALDALNRNRRTYSFKGLGDTHKNYPFNIPF